MTPEALPQVSSTDSLFVEELNCVWPNVNKTYPSAVRIQMPDHSDDRRRSESQRFAAMGNASTWNAKRVGYTLRASHF